MGGGGGVGEVNKTRESIEDGKGLELTNFIQTRFICSLRFSKCENRDMAPVT